MLTLQSHPMMHLQVLIVEAPTLYLAPQIILISDNLVWNDLLINQYLQDLST